MVSPRVCLRHSSLLHASSLSLVSFALRARPKPNEYCSKKKKKRERIPFILRSHSGAQRPVLLRSKDGTYLLGHPPRSALLPPRPVSVRTICPSLLKKNIGGWATGATPPSPRAHISVRGSPSPRWPWTLSRGCPLRGKALPLISATGWLPPACLRSFVWGGTFHAADENG